MGQTFEEAITAMNVAITPVAAGNHVVPQRDDDDINVAIIAVLMHQNTPHDQIFTRVTREYDVVGNKQNFLDDFIRALKISLIIENETQERIKKIQNFIIKFLSKYISQNLLTLIFTSCYTNINNLPPNDDKTIAINAFNKNVEMNVKINYNSSITRENFNENTRLINNSLKKKLIYQKCYLIIKDPLYKNELQDYMDVLCLSDLFIEQVIIFIEQVITERKDLFARLENPDLPIDERKEINTKIQLLNYNIILNLMLC